MPSLLKLSFIVTVALLSLSASAGSDHHDHGHHSHDEHNHEQKAHVHGVSQMELAIGDNLVEIQFDSPANNIVGFEHTAKTEKDIKVVNQAKTTLGQPDTLFRFKGTSCKPLSTQINVLGLLDNHKHNHRESSHKEISAHYRFKCDSTDELTSIQFELINQFPNISEIRTQWISESNQGMVVLTQKNHQLGFGG